MPQADFTLTYAEYREANRLVLMNTSFSRKMNHIISNKVVPIVGVLLAAFSLWVIATSTRGKDMSSGWILFLLGVFWSIIPLINRMRVNKRYKQQKLNRGMSLMTDDDRLEIRTLNGDADSRINWPAFEKYAESKQLFVLMLDPVRFIPIPKRALSPEHQQEIRGFFAGR